MIRVILAGEGRNELGDLVVEAPFRPQGKEAQPGVLESLLRQVRREGWEVVDALPWKTLPKLQVGLGRKGEEHNVRRAHHHAKKRGCDVLVFTRDRDGVKFAHREEDIERAVEDLQSNGGGPAIVGAVAVEKLEAWLLAVAGKRQSEAFRRPEQELVDLGVGEKDTAAMVSLIERCGLGAVPEDARSLRKWLSQAHDALAEGASPAR